VSHGVHLYRVRVSWTGSTAVGYDHYDRTHRWSVLDPSGTEVGLSDRLSSDPAFRGDPALVNPEQLLVAAAASCQLLSFLAVAARARLDVTDYTDEAEGEMPEGRSLVGLREIRLNPRFTVRATDAARPSGDRIRHLVEVGHRECFIANSLSTAVTVEPSFEVF
jgi:organic hydroperoxide reductase OsmC/OhrA